jgi:tripartite-type tricarboxylate transporter receptor subunit TctC
MRTLTLAAITLAPVVAASIALPAQAQQDYPSRTVTVVNPTQAGATEAKKRLIERMKLQM